jgi:hypothetical protein
MLIIFGVWFAVAGGVAMLAGLSGMRRVRRLRRSGLTAWGLPVTAPVSAGRQSDDSPDRMLLQYTLADGRVMERIAPPPTRKSALLRPGEKVLMWYDPEDPDDVLIYGRWGRATDRAFVGAGALFVLIGAAIAIFGH